MNDFHNTMECYAICTYLKSFGYEARVDQNTLTTCVQVPLHDTFIVLTFPTWEVAREFIRVSSQRQSLMYN